MKLKMSSVPAGYLTPERYLEQERKAAFKSEYYQGETFAMTGATRWHSLIVGNIAGELRQALRQRPCEVYSSDMRVRVSTTGLYTYPDVAVVCGEPAFADDQKDTLLNPTALVEVLSDSTKDYDRGQKFQHYRKLDSLQDYLAVSQTTAHVEHYARQADERWLLTDIRGLEAEVTLYSVNITLPLSEIYFKVQLAEG